MGRSPARHAGSRQKRGSVRDGNGPRDLPTGSRSASGEAITQQAELPPLQKTLHILRRHWRLLALCTFLVPFVALTLSAFQEKRYTASAFLLFRDPAIDEKVFGTSFFAPGTDPEREAATNVKLVSLGAVAERTAAAMRTPGLTGAAVAGSIDVSAAGESNLVQVGAEQADPRAAAKLANTFAREFIEFRADADRSRVRQAQELVERQLDRLTPEQAIGPEGERLRERAQQLGLLASLQTGNAELVERAKVPGAPSSPQTKRNVGLGALLGLMLGVGAAFLREQLDRRLRDPEEIQRSLGLPLLASIPQVSAMYDGVRFDLRQDEAADETFGLLRANLRYFNVDRQIKSLLIISAAPDEGKTTISWHLALAEARAGKRVVLVEADLRQAELADRLGAGPTPGLSLLLAEVQSIEDSIVSVDVAQIEAAGPAALDVIFAGSPPPNPTALIESTRMNRLLRELEASYDLVLIDTPPTSLVADAIPLMRQVSGVIVVARVGYGTRDDASGLRDQLRRLDAPVLGVVVNGTKARGNVYYQRPGIAHFESERGRWRP